MSGLKRANAVSSSDMASALGRPLKRHKPEPKRSFNKPHFVVYNNEDSDEGEEIYSDEEDNSATDPEPSEPEDSECVECGDSSCDGKCGKAAKKTGGRADGRSKFFCVTDHRGTVQDWRDNFNADLGLTWVSGQGEICPETKKKHLQLYTELKRETTRRAFNKKFGKHLHVESRKGTQQEAKEYCEKKDTRDPDQGPFQMGTLASGSGKTSEQVRAIEAVKKGTPLEDVARDFSGAWVRNYKGLTSLAGALQEERKDHVPIKALCLWGPPGGGKTWKAVEIAKVFRSLFTRW